MSERLAIVGQVMSGRGRAAVEVSGHAEELKSILGADLIAGSLNVVFKRPIKLVNEKAIRFDNEKRLLWPASVNGVSVWLYRWRHAPLHIAELLSTVHLRDALGLADGDEIILELRKADVDRVPVIGKFVWGLCWIGRRQWCYKNHNYYARTRGCCINFGATQQDIQGSGWNLFMAIAKSMGKRLPGMRALAKYLRHVAGVKNHPVKPYSFERMPLDCLYDSDERSYRQLLNLLSYTKTSGSIYSANQYSAGYHTIEINGRELQGQRNPAKRLAHVPIDFRGKTVLDIGCNQGGMLFALADELRWGIGVDYDSRMINAANRIKSLRDTGGLNFYTLDLEREPLELVEDFIPEPKVDVVFLLSVCMWLKNWQEIIVFARRIGDTMIFESNGSDEQQSAQQAYLETLYRNVSLLNNSSDDDPKQKRRKLFYCYQTVEEHARPCGPLDKPQRPASKAGMV